MDSCLNNSHTRTVRSRPFLYADLLLRMVMALFELTKPRIAFASVVTVIAAYVSAGGTRSVVELFILFCASGMAAGGSLAFNQWWERDTDPLMKRTCARPLPRSCIPAWVALAWSIFLSIAGVLWLLLAFNGLTAAIGVATILVYAGIYTPMKRKSRWATEVGSISGALPPLLGAAAAGNIGSVSAWVLAIALFFWQMPHFFSIGWIHRKDYRAAGLPLLPAVDRTGRLTANWSFVYTIFLCLTLMIPWSLGMIGGLFGTAAVLGSIWMLVLAWKFKNTEGTRETAARKLFRTSLIVMPIILFV